MPAQRVLLILLALCLSLSTRARAAEPAVVTPPTADLLPPQAAVSDWPWWRGPLGSAVSPDATAPTSWSTSEHVLWKVPVPGRGHASPVVCGERVFLATADNAAQQQRLVAIDRITGQPLWNTLIHTGGFMKKHPENSHASPTPACDGQRVYAAFINADAQWITAVNLDGKIAWQKNVGPHKVEHGDGGSPVLYKNLVILNSDGVGECFIAALDRATGEIAWKTPREPGPRHANYGGPMLANVAGRMQILLTGNGRTFSYNPENGAVLWSCEGPAEVAANTMAAGNGLAFASAGFPEKVVMAIRADGSGDVTDTHVIWRSTRSHAYVPSPVYYDGRLYVVSDDGIATCYNATSGRQLWQRRLGGNFFASPIVAGGNVYAANDKGSVHIFKAGDEYQEVAKIEMDETIMATPAICGGKIYLRTERNLYCISGS